LGQYNLQHNLQSKVNLSDGDNTTLWLLNADGTIVSKKVELGASDGVNVQILNGITAGDDLVYSLKSVNKSEVQKGATNESPFMPKPPGSKKK